MNQTDRGWQWLGGSPADRNDRYKLELSRAWEPSYSERLMPNGEGQGSHGSLPYGD
jgi:hypothetical protein